MLHVRRSTIRHPKTGQAPIGFTRQGVPIWPIAGGADDPPAPTPDPDPDPDDPDPDDPPAPDKGKDEPGDKGFPENTPVAEMTADQQAAYWKHQSRKHEDRANARKDYDELKAKASELDELKRSQMSDQEKAVEAAKAEARTTTLQEVGVRLVDAEIRAQSAGRLSDEQRTVLLEGLDRNRFLTEDGDVDTDKVTTFIDGIAPTSSDDGKGKKFPDLGQGRRNGKPKASVATGRDLYADRKKKST